jgi:hypothetical protein
MKLLEPKIACTCIRDKYKGIFQTRWKQTIVSRSSNDKITETKEIPTRPINSDLTGLITCPATSDYRKCGCVYRLVGFFKKFWESLNFVTEFLIFLISMFMLRVYKVH